MEETNRKNTIEALLERLDQTGECWLWTDKIRKDGYVSMWFYGKKTNLHRIMYEHFVGPIPEGLHIDHLCRVRHCCNPEHLEAVTQEENIRRSLQYNANLLKTHCDNGHEFTEENTYRYGNQRVCKECRLHRGKKRRLETDYDKKYYEDNKLRLLELQRQWRLVNKEKKKQYAKQYYLKKKQNKTQ